MRTKLNNYCFKCLSTELLLLGGADIFCSNCLLVFQDVDTHDFLRFHAKSPIPEGYSSMGSYNFDTMLRVFIGWLTRINILFKINEFFIDISYVSTTEDTDEETSILKKTIPVSIDNVLDTLKNELSNKPENKEHFNFIDTSIATLENEYRGIKFSCYTMFRTVRYNIADFNVWTDDYKEHDLHFEDWDLYTVPKGSFDTSFVNLKSAYNRYQQN